MAGRAGAVILAAGSGRRAGQTKQFARAGGKSLLAHAVQPFLRCREIGAVVVVVPRGQLVRARREVGRSLDPVRCQVVVGGATRHRSSARGLAALPAGVDAVLIHDAARPFVTPTLIRRVLRAARQHGAAMPAVPVTDSTIEVGGDGRLVRYLPRERLRAVQTPQGFERGLLEAAFARTRRRDFLDDASVVRAAGNKVTVVAGEPQNRKVTSASDLRDALRQLGG